MCGGIFKKLPNGINAARAIANGGGSPAGGAGMFSSLIKSGRARKKAPSDAPAVDTVLR